MQQRVTIAMALACKPRLLIADEPTTALDVTIQAQILKLMKDLQMQTGTSILLITHNLGVVAETCERVGVMYAGVMAEIGPVRSIFKEPLHPYTQGLMNSIPKLKTQGARLDIIPGNVPNLVHPPSGCRFHPRCQFAMEICKKEKPPMLEVRPEHFVACHLYTREAS
jgi:oligopeptide/dipeptide ABC transporter ATP-binding protein